MAGALWLFGIAGVAAGSDCARCQAVPSRCVAIDTDGDIWVVEGAPFSNALTKLDPSSGTIATFDSGGNGCDRGIAATPADNHIWVASAFCKDEAIPPGPDDVTRLDNNGILCELIGDIAPYNFRPDSPTGAAVDGDGYVWVTHDSIPDLRGSVTRIRPGTDPPPPCGGR